MKRLMLGRLCLQITQRLEVQGLVVFVPDFLFGHIQEPGSGMNATISV
jgi:hypothetical protein